MSQFTVVLLVGVATMIAYNYFKKEDEVSNEYDFIIVGGGTAACVVAKRLSEANATVLMLEAGKSDKSYIFSRIPIAFHSKQVLIGPTLPFLKNT
jgi:Na+/glutamate symporter